MAHRDTPQQRPYNPLNLIEIDSALRVEIGHDLAALALLPLALLWTDRHGRYVLIRR
jgi:hypothetical protein